MSSATQRFFYRFRKGIFPDPEQSVGELELELPHNVKIWEAVGRVQILYCQLAVKIGDYLRENNITVYGELSWGVRMVGDRPETSRPTVVFIGPEADTRKAAKRLIKSSGILKSYPGFETMDWNRPPASSRGGTERGAGVILLGTSTNTSATDIDLFSGIYTDTNLHILKEGAAVICVTQKDTNTAERKSASAGGILRFGDQIFVMTVAHICPGYAEGPFPGEAKYSEFECEIDTWDEDNDLTMDLEDRESEQMSKASMSNNSSSSYDDQFWDKTQRMPQEKTAAKVRRTSNHDSCRREDVSIVMEERNGNHARIFQQPVLSLDSQNQLLDYALLPISKTQSDLLNGNYANMLRGPAKASETSLSTIETIPGANADVVAILPSGGKSFGRLLSTPTFLSNGLVAMNTRNCGL